MQQLPRIARIYLCIIYLAGLAAMIIATTPRYRLILGPGDGWDVLILAMTAMLAGSKKVLLLGGKDSRDEGSMSLGFLITFVALLRSGPAAGVIIGAVSSLSAGVWPKPRPIHQIVFNVSVAVISSLAAGMLLGRGIGERLGTDPISSFPNVASATLVYFFINTFAVALVIALCSGQKATRLWKETFLWTAPGYFSAACVSTMAIVWIGPRIGAMMLFGSPVAYLTYQSYKHYVDKAEELTRRAALSVENARLYREAQIELAERKRAEEELLLRNEELAALNALTAAVSASLELPEILETLRWQLAERLHIPAGAIFTLRPNQKRQRVEVSWGLTDAALRFLDKTSGTADDAAAASTSVELAAPDVVRKIGWNVSYVIPLLAEGRIQGRMYVCGSGNDHVADEHKDFYEALGRQVGVAIQNARLFEEVRSSREELQGLSHRLVDVQEQERSSIARELHDEVGQILTGLKLVLEMHRRRPNDSDGLDRADALVNDLMSRVRQMSLDLRPTMLDDLGLIPALLWLFQRYTSQTGIRVIFEQSGMEERFSMQLETAAYRIVQEALTNIARYAGTEQGTVRLWRNGDHLCVNVRDCGKGFVPEAVVSKRTTAGLAGMSERAKLLGGRLHIDSAPGEGTLLSAELPVTLREEQLTK